MALLKGILSTALVTLNTVVVCIPLVILGPVRLVRITSYNVCYTKLLRTPGLASRR